MRKKGLALVCVLGLVLGIFSGAAGSPGEVYASGASGEPEAADSMEEPKAADSMKEPEAIEASGDTEPAGEWGIVETEEPEESEASVEIVAGTTDSDVIIQDEPADPDIITMDPADAEEENGTIMAAKTDVPASMEENNFSGELETLAGDELVLVNLPVEYAQSSARDMLALINNFRTGSGAWYWNKDNQTKTYLTGLGKLTYDKNLEAIAMQRAVETALSFSHTRPNGSSCFSCTSNGVVSYGENIAAGYPGAREIFMMWKEDQAGYLGQGHRRNMLNGRYKSVGIGHVVYNGQHFWAQEFGLDPAQGGLPAARNEKGANASVYVATSNVSRISGISSSAGEITLQGKGSRSTLPGVSCGGLTMKLAFYSVGSCIIYVSWKAADPSLLKVEGDVVTSLIDKGKSEVYADVFGKRITCSVEVGATMTTPGTKVEESQAQTLILGERRTLDITGTGRVETSFLLADQMKKALGVEKFRAVILASGADYPDGLGASTLSVRYNAPILVVVPNANEEEKVKQYIESNLIPGGKIFIVGGSGAVSRRMQTIVSGLGVVTRLEGRGRYETNIQIIKELLANGAEKDELLVVSGKDYADALSVSATGKIIMIVGDRLTEEQKTLMKTSGFGKMTIIGGSGAVSENVRTEIAGITGKHPERLGGKGRVETSRLVAKKYFPNSTVSVYTKANQFADGLAGGLLAYTLGSPMRLVFGQKDMIEEGSSIRLGGVK